MFDAQNGSWSPEIGIGTLLSDDSRSWLLLFVYARNNTAGTIISGSKHFESQKRSAAAIFCWKIQ
eukprot:scaffold2168_cov180-Amphora_coffeaeformis.AAC.11